MKKSVLLAIFIPLLASAQELEKEITIEREIEPELRAATRLNIYPHLRRPEARQVPLSFGDYSQWGQLTPMLSVYEPAYTGPSVEQSPWRGFVEAAYITERNAGLRAGYRVISDERTRLSVGVDGRYLDYDGSAVSYGEKIKMNVKRVEAGANAGFSHLFDAGRLSLDTRLRFSRINYPDDPMRNALDWRLGAKWEGTPTLEGLGYGFRGGYRLFNFAREKAGSAQPMRQHSFSLGGNAIQRIDAHSAAGVDISADMLASNHYGTIDDKGRTHGYLALRPRWEYDNGVVTARLGIRADVSFNAGKVLHIAPDILAGYNPESWLGIALRLGGGEHLNPLAELYGEAPCFSPWYSYGMSHIPFEGGLKLSVGPFRGFAVELGADYAAANAWLMPLSAAGVAAVWEATDLRSVKAGVRLSWRYRSIVNLSVGFDAVCAGGRRGAWYEWRDRSRQRLEAEVAVRPIGKLEVRLGYTRRMDRSMAVADDAGAITLSDLCDYDDLSAKISYEVLKPLRVFAGGNNLLDTRSFEPFGVPCQGINGQIGFIYKF